MADRTDLMNLGLFHLLAARLGRTRSIVTAYGTSAGSANALSGDQYFTIVNTGTSSLRLPGVGADIGAGTGALVGDMFLIGNISAASVAVYASNNTLGSVVTMYTPGQSTAGTTGVSVGVGSLCMFLPVTVSTWYVSYMSA